MIWRDAVPQNWEAPSETEQCAVRCGSTCKVLPEMEWNAPRRLSDKWFDLLLEGKLILFLASWGESRTFILKDSSIKIFHDFYIIKYIHRRGFSVMEMFYVHWMNCTGPFNKVKALTSLLLTKEGEFSIANWCCWVAFSVHIILGSWAFLVPVLVSLRTADNINLKQDLCLTPGCFTWLCFLPAAWPWADHWTSLSQSFFVYEMIMDDVMIKMR